MLDQLLNLFRGLEVQPVAILDVILTALLIYWLFSLIRGTRAVRLVIGITVLYAIYVAAGILGLQLLSQILQTGAVVGLLAIVVVFQPELRRALERLGQVGSVRWLLVPAALGQLERTAATLARSAASLSARRVGALIVVERETGLEDAAESGVMVHSDLSAEMLGAIFAPHSPLHDGAVIIRGGRIVAAGAVLPLSETAVYRERFGTRHRAALGITEQTDAIAIVVSEETGAIGLVERGRILRNLDEERLRTALMALLRSGGGRLPPGLERGLRLRTTRRSRERDGARAGRSPSKPVDDTVGDSRAAGLPTRPSGPASVATPGGPAE